MIKANPVYGHMAYGKIYPIPERNQLYRLFTEFLIAPSLLAELLGDERLVNFPRKKSGGVEGCRDEWKRRYVYYKMRWK